MRIRLLEAVVLTAVVVVFSSIPSFAQDAVFRPAVTGLVQPLEIAHADDGSGRLFVVEQRGTIRIVRGEQLQPGFFLDIRDRVASEQGEQGLLGLAFDPLYPANGFLYVNYIRRGDSATVVSRFQVSAFDADSVEVRSELILMVIPQPTLFHNGGHMAFGPDGFLYVATGDGGGLGRARAQDLGVLHGKLLRIDVASSTAQSRYAIPPDNPFVGVPGARPEIWAYGLRNPWKFSFDRLTGDLWIGDVGENSWEEVNLQPAGSRGGENYGWPVFEGIQCFAGLTECDYGDNWTWPVAFYETGRRVGTTRDCSVTGGFVYRGSLVPAVQGAYLFGDFCSGRIFLGRRGFTRLIDVRSEGASVVGLLSSFGEDEDGEIYAVSYGRGWLSVMEPAEDRGRFGPAASSLDVGGVLHVDKSTPSRPYLPGRSQASTGRRSRVTRVD